VLGEDEIVRGSCTHFPAPTGASRRCESEAGAARWRTNYRL